MFVDFQSHKMILKHFEFETVLEYDDIIKNQYFLRLVSHSRKIIVSIELFTIEKFIIFQTSTVNHSEIEEEMFKEYTFRTRIQKKHYNVQNNFDEAFQKRNKKKTVKIVDDF